MSCLTQFPVGIEIKELLQYLILGLILMLGIILRLINFRRKGLFLWDEAAFYREALGVLVLARFIKDNLRTFIELKRKPSKLMREELASDYLKIQEASNYSYYKPWLTALNMAAIRLVREKDTAVCLQSLVLGTATPAVMFFAVRNAIGAPAALAAAFVLAVSGLHILHSRSAEQECGVTFCYMMMLLCSLTHKSLLAASGPGWFFSDGSVLLMVAAGFFLGGVLMFNAGWSAVFPPLFVLTEAVFAAASGVVTSGFFAVFVLIGFASAFVVIILTDIPFVIAKYLFPESKVDSHLKYIFNFIIRGYRVMVERVSGKIDLGVELPWTFRYMFYPGLLYGTEGAVVLCAAAAGAALMAVSGTPEKIFLVTHGAFVLFYLTFVPLKATRGAVHLLPCMAVFAGYCLAHVPMAVMISAAAWICFRGIRYALKIVKLKSGVRAAAEAVHGAGYDRFLCTAAPFNIVYGSMQVGAFVPKSYTGLREMYKFRETRFLIVEYHKYFPSLLYDSTVEMIEKHMTPVLEAEDPAVTFYPLLAECEIYSPLTFGVTFEENAKNWNRFRMSPRPEDGKVRVYDLKELFEKPGMLEKLGPNALIDEGDLLFKMGKYNDAITVFKKAQRLAPDDPIAKYNIALCHVKMGREKWAAAGFRELRCNEKLTKKLRDFCDEFIQKYDKIIENNHPEPGEPDGT